MAVIEGTSLAVTASEAFASVVASVAEDASVLASFEGAFPEEWLE